MSKEVKLYFHANSTPVHQYLYFQDFYLTDPRHGDGGCVGIRGSGGWTGFLVAEGFSYLLRGWCFSWLIMGSLHAHPTWSVDNL